MQLHIDDVFMQSQTKEELFTVLEKYHKTSQNGNMKAAPDKSHFLLTHYRKKHRNPIEISHRCNPKTSTNI